MLKQLIVLLITCSLLLGSEEIGQKPRHCVYHGKEIPESSDFVSGPIGYCVKVKCNKAEGNNLMMLTCPEMVLPPGFFWGEKDLKKEYPHCCPKAIKNQ
ncbi:hypothetical protein FQA39_LY13274 [Lamprigera yunnana]|nr:hypothetical protein FQA39_LY13274 [Lamprigera yunnana]